MHTYQHAAGIFFATILRRRPVCSYGYAARLSLDPGAFTMSVFHLDIEAFMTSVARIHDPALRKRPLVVVPDSQRATVLAASPDAKQLGINKGLPAPLLAMTGNAREPDRAKVMSSVRPSTK